MICVRRVCEAYLQISPVLVGCTHYSYICNLIFNSFTSLDCARFYRSGKRSTDDLFYNLKMKSVRLICHVFSLHSRLLICNLKKLKKEKTTSISKHVDDHNTTGIAQVSIRDRFRPCSTDSSGGRTTRKPN